MGVRAQTKVVPGSTRTQGVDKLSYYEMIDDPVSAITREKHLKEVGQGVEDSINRRYPRMD